VNRGTPEELYEILGGFDDAMLVTRRKDGLLRSRPMAIADCSTDGVLWFLTSVDSRKIDDLTENPFVDVTMQDGKRFVSLSGTVKITRDADVIDRLWTQTQEAWFEKGRADPTLTALEIVPLVAEYWDRTGLKRLQFLLIEANAVLTGKTASDGPGHVKVDFRE
jgi:general stress protein 26